jgi:hypothetical protein
MDPLSHEWYKAAGFEHQHIQLNQPPGHSALMPEMNLKRKPRDQSTIAKPPVKRKKTEDRNAPCTSAQAPPVTSRKNLTLADWLTVYAFIDQHSTVRQGDVVRHFTTLQSGALIFDQSTLSHKLRERPKKEARVNDNPSALSSKRPRVVTSPQVERALILWVQQMEHNGESVTGPMLREKRQRIEEELGIPEEERLPGDGWIVSFCKTYNIREHC